MYGASGFKLIGLVEVKAKSSGLKVSIKEPMMAVSGPDDDSGVSALFRSPSVAAQVIADLERIPILEREILRLKSHRDTAFELTDNLLKDPSLLSRLRLESFKNELTHGEIDMDNYRSFKMRMLLALIAEGIDIIPGTYPYEAVKKMREIYKEYCLKHKQELPGIADGYFLKFCIEFIEFKEVQKS